LFFPIMAAMIIELIFRENLRAREKQKVMLEEIRFTNSKLEIYADRLKDESLRLQAEVNIARKIQTMVLPSRQEIAGIDELDISCIMRTADEVGGDYYDVIKIGDTVTIGIGDVTGHGLSSGIIMLMAQTVVRTLAELRITDTRRFLCLVNKVLFANIRRIREDRNMTLAIVSYSKGSCAVAGQHESVVVQRAGGYTEVIDTLGLGFYVGLMEDVEDHVKSATFSLAPGDFILLYSDGITEAMNPAGEQFGLARICECARRYSALGAEKILAKTMKDLYNYMAETGIEDDISLVVVKQK
jgi:phosphoserine phosphatase RsbU/P